MALLLAILFVALMTGCNSPEIGTGQALNYIPDSLGKNKYVNVELYEPRTLMGMTLSPRKLQVAVTEKGLLDPKYTAVKVLYLKAGDAYNPVRVVTVLMEEYRKKETRRDEMQATLQLYLLSAAGIGFVLAIGAAVSAYMVKPWWDELAVVAAALMSFGLAGAWWVEQLPWIALFAVLAMLVPGAYSIWKRGRQHKAQEEESFDIATVLEQMKMLAPSTWAQVKPSVEQSARTKVKVAKLKTKAKEAAAERLKDMASSVRTGVASVMPCANSATDTPE